MEKYTLPNGLTVILQALDRAESVAIHVAVGAGARYETKETAGLAHFLEHMLFEGTKEYPNAKKLAEYIENVGGKCGAFTDKDHVMYYVKMLPTELERGIQFLNDILFTSLLSEDTIEKEKNIVFEEMKRTEDNPEGEVWEVFNTWVWGKAQSLGRSTLGSKETIKSVTQEKLRTYMQTFYHPSNMVLSVVGNIDIPKIKPLIESIFNENDNKTSHSFDSVQSISHKENIKISPYSAQQCQVIIGFPNTVSYTHPDRYPLTVLATLLGGASSARLFHTLVYELGIAYSMGAYNWIGSDYGTFSLYGGFSEENIIKALRVIIQELSNLKMQRISEKELQETKQKAKANIFFYTETTDALANLYTSQMISEKKILTLEQLAEEIDKVSTEDIHRVANMYFKNSLARLLIRGKVSKTISQELERELKNL